MIAYLVKSSLCLLVLWAFYRLILEKEKFHGVKRFYLLFCLAFSFGIPLITFTYVEEVYYNPTEVILSEEIPVTYSEIPQQNQNPEVLYYALFALYLLGVIVFALRFIRNLYRLYTTVNTNEKKKDVVHTNVLLNKKIIPYSFLKYIFLPKREFESGAIPEEILLHEKAHVIQRHTWDILFIEFVQVIFWFNPLLIFIKKAIQLNHEFLADQSVVNKQFSIKNYLNLLVNYPVSPNQAALTSPINYSLTKKRIFMMSKQFSKTRAVTRLLLLIPVILGCILLFNNQIIAQQKNTWTYTETVSTDQDKNITIKVSGNSIEVNGKSTTLDNFAQTLDEITKSWNKGDLANANLNIKLNNADEGVLNKLNTEYRTTAFFKANPDRHDLIPPPPPAPPAPIMAKSSAIPPPPPVAKKNSDVPPAPPAPEEIEIELEETEQEIELSMIRAEEARENAERRAMIAMETSERVRERAERSAEEAMAKAEEARRRAEVSMQETEYRRVRSTERQRVQLERRREEAERAMRLAKEEADRARTMAREQVEVARVQANQAREMARVEAQRAREEAMVMAAKAREMARVEAQVAREASMKETQELRRRYEKDRKEMLKAEEKALKEQLRTVKKQIKEEKKSKKN